MTWNYRIIKRTDSQTGKVGYHLHEVYYNSRGEIQGMTETPDSPFGETLEEFVHDLENMLKDAKSQSVLEWEKIKFAPMDD